MIKLQFWLTFLWTTFVLVFFISNLIYTEKNQNAKVKLYKKARPWRRSVYIHTSPHIYFRLQEQLRPQLDRLETTLNNLIRNNTQKLATSERKISDDQKSFEVYHLVFSLFYSSDAIDTNIIGDPKRWNNFFVLYKNVNLSQDFCYFSLSPI